MRQPPAGEAVAAASLRTTSATTVRVAGVVEMRIVRSQLFLNSLTALQRAEPALFEVVAADLRYLLERRRDAQLP
jgi:hypothetical protein